MSSNDNYSGPRSPYYTPYNDPSQSGLNAPVVGGLWRAGQMMFNGPDAIDPASTAMTANASTMGQQAGTQLTKALGTYNPSNYDGLTGAQQATGNAAQGAMTAAQGFGGQASQALMGGWSGNPSDVMNGNDYGTHDTMGLMASLGNNGNAAQQQVQAGQAQQNAMGQSLANTQASNGAGAFGGMSRDLGKAQAANAANTSNQLQNLNTQAYGQYMNSMGTLANQQNTQLQAARGQYQSGLMSAAGGLNQSAQLQSQNALGLQQGALGYLDSASNIALSAQKANQDWQNQSGQSTGQATQALGTGIAAVVAA